jgi:hypothetical protein
MFFFAPAFLPIIELIKVKTWHSIPDRLPHWLPVQDSL